MNPGILIAAALTLPAIIVALPAVCDLWALIAKRREQPDPGETAPAALVFLIPAHNESLLIARCIESLLGQVYPRDKLTVAVVADNCTDDTAEAARRGGALVLERATEDRRGKGHAIEWALQRLPLEQYAAVIIVDADTIVAPDYAQRISDWSPLEEKAVQSYDGMSNEFENWLTRMAGVLTRNRYGIAMPLKVRAGLNVPLTGDGTVLGTGLLRRLGWNVKTITEGWELYTRYTLEGIDTYYEDAAKLYAQETRSLAQSRTQRERWTAGRLAVLRLYWKSILFRRGPSLHQRLDLLAELSNLGPIMRAALGVTGFAIVLATHVPGRYAYAVLFTTGVAQPLVYSLISLARHPQPLQTAFAFLMLPGYALWRVLVGLGAFMKSGQALWVRTSRHRETRAP